MLWKSREQPGVWPPCLFLRELSLPASSTFVGDKSCLSMAKAKFEHKWHKNRDICPAVDLGGLELQWGVCFALVVL